jgi:hypothetical protein
MRQFCDVRRRSPARLILEINIRERLTVVIGDNKTGVLLRTSASVLSVMMLGISSGRGKGRDQSARLRIQ